MGLYGAGTTTRAASQPLIALPTSSKVLCAVYGAIAIAISVTFPLFLIARELRVGRTETTRLGAVDTVLLAVLAVAVVGITIWVDMG